MIATVEAQLRAFFADQAPEVLAAYLFGSVARGGDTPDSDVDVAIIRAAEAPRPLGRLGGELAGRLERVLGRDVEVVDLERAPVDLVHRILRDGVLVCERDRSKRIDVETRQRARFFDMQRILDQYRGRNR